MATRWMDTDHYVCARCLALLTVPDIAWRGWLHCPNCGLPSLPPAQLTAGRPRKRSAAIESRESQPKTAGLVGPSSASAPSAHPSLARVQQSGSRSSARLIVSTGLFVSAFLLLVAYLDRKPHNMTIFGGLTVIFLILNLRVLRQR